jgi:hypothetical protein
MRIACAAPIAVSRRPERTRQRIRFGALGDRHLGRHRDRADRMEMREHGAVVAQHDRVRRHAHVGLERGGLTVGCVHREAQRPLLADRDRLGPALPRDDRSVAQCERLARAGAG